MIFVQSDGTASRRRFPIYLVDATDGITPETGEAGGQPQVSKAGGAWANTTATLTAIGNGSYYVELTAAEINTVGLLMVRYKSANTAEFSAPGVVYNINIYDAVRAGLTALPNANAAALGGLFTRGTGAGQINQDANGRIDVNLAAWLGSAPSGLTSGNVPANVTLMQANSLNVTAPTAAFIAAIQSGLATATSITTLQALTETLQYLLHGNAVVDNTVHGASGTTSARLRGFANAAAAAAATNGAADGADGEVARWTITTSYDGPGEIATHRLTRTL